ncbi:Pam16-domain-containing protein [Gorgonomyces haynaldii]|nr:Pam16-domain-containing protein [Gorgonomyces haynaldii]
MNPARVLVQVVVTGATILGRAFVEAYKTTSQQTAAGGTAILQSKDIITRKTGMTLDEAQSILNVERNATLEDIKKNYTHLFNANDPEKGGSFYLQSKVYRAKERLDLESAREQIEAKHQE